MLTCVARVIRRLFAPLCALVPLLCAQEASPREYEQAISLGSEEDIYELLQRGEIIPETADLLLGLYQRPIDLNRADRELIYELPSVTYALADAILAARSALGGFRIMSDLMQVEGMTTEVFETIAAFVVVSDTQGASADFPSQFDTASEARLGTLLRRGFGRDPNTVAEIASSPQAYLRLRGTALDHFGAGALVTHRTRMQSYWDFSRGHLVSDGPRDDVDCSNLYVYWGAGPWSFIAGSYTVGFAERLTFDSTTYQHPNGWYENDAVSEVRRTARLRPSERTRGFAASVKGIEIPGGWLDATVFVSSARFDAYQYDIWHGFDPWYSRDDVCDSDAQCPTNYTCGRDKRCHARVCNSTDPDQCYAYVTFTDAFRETLAGANLTLMLSERVGIGLTTYGATTDILLAATADPEFSWSSRYPRRQRFGALGIDGRARLGSLSISGEVAVTDRHAAAAFARLVYDLHPWAELTVTARSYSAEYDNPHSRAEAAADSSMGNRARNERGIRLRATITPQLALKLVSDIDVWENPFVPALTDARQLAWVSAEEAPRDLRITQRIALDLTAHESAAVLLSYANNDLRHNGRGESYASSGWDFEEPENDDGPNAGYWQVASFSGRGERRRVQLSSASTRVRGLRVSASFAWAWEDVGKLRHRFDLERWLRLRIQARPWHRTTVAASASYWIHHVERDEDDFVYHDRHEPALDTYVDLGHRMNDTFFLRLRYGVLHFRDDRPDRFAYYHVVKLAIDAKL